MPIDGKPFGFMNPAKVIMVVHENLLKSRLQRTQSIFDRLAVADFNFLAVLFKNMLTIHC